MRVGRRGRIAPFGMARDWNVGQSSQVVESVVAWDSLPLQIDLLLQLRGVFMSLQVGLIAISVEGRLVCFVVIVDFRCGSGGRG